MEPYCWFVGIDWGNAEDQICLTDAQGCVLDERSVEHSGAGLASLAEWLWDLSGGEPHKVAVCLERPTGAVVETLLEREFHIFSINPKQLDRFRDRHTVAGAKDDRRDAFVLASSLRTDTHLFRRIQPQPALISELREVYRMEQDLTKQKQRFCNQLRELLQRFYVTLLGLCPAADERWLWSLLQVAPTPAQGARLTRAKIKAILREHRIRRLTVEQVREALAATPLHVAPGVAEGISARVRSLLPILRAVDEQERQCAHRGEELLNELEEEGSREHRDDVRILRSQPGLGRKGVAAMLAEAYQHLAERDYHTLRSRMGVAPVTSQTGKQGKVRGKRPRVIMRRACSPRLRETAYHWARVATQQDARARSHYDKLRGNGHKHGRALRGVADRLLGRLIPMLCNQTTYDPDHQSHQTQVAKAAVNA